MNWPIAPWIVLARSTVSARRKCQPAFISPRNRGRRAAVACGGPASAAGLVGRDAAFGRQPFQWPRWLHGGRPAARLAAPAAPAAARRSGGITIVPIITADATYVAASNQNASGSAAAQEGHEQPGQRVADDVRQRLGDPRRRVRGQELVAGHDPRHHRGPRRPEEDRDRRHEEDQRVDQDQVDRRRDRHEQDRRRPQEVADDHDLLLVPAVHERAGDRAQEQVRQRGGEEHEAHRERRVGRREDQERQRDLVHPVAEQADELAHPERRERAVEGQPDVGVASGALDEDRDDGDGGRQRETTGARTGRFERQRDRADGGAREPGRRSAEPEWPLQGGRFGQSGVSPDWPASPRSSYTPASRRRHTGTQAACPPLGIGSRSARASSGRPDDRGEQEEPQPGRQEDVADRGDVAKDRDGDRDDVAEEPEVQQEVRVERRRDDDVERRRDLGRRNPPRAGWAPRSACSRRWRRSRRRCPGCRRTPSPCPAGGD